MLTVYTSTFCRPDYVDLLSQALRITLQEPYRFVVFVHPGGLVRRWAGVDEVVQGSQSGFSAIFEILDAISGPSVVLHDDMIPVLPWSQASFPLPHACRFGGHTLHYHADGFARPVPLLMAKRVWYESDCEDAWPPELRKAAAAARVETMLDGVFLHIDKGTTFHPESPVVAEKPALVVAICKHLGCEIPAPLTDAELAIHPGRRGGVPVASPPAARKSARPNIKETPTSGPGPGPGTELKRLLERIGITAKPTCSCNARARTMDANGCDWCEANLDEIVGWLREEATKRKLPFVDMAGRVLVRRAIRNARKEQARAKAKDGKAEGSGSAV